MAQLLADLESEKHWIGRRIETTFTDEERSAARFLALDYCWTSGYPEPSDITVVPGLRCLPFEVTTYNLSDRCMFCGVGPRQKALFRMKGEPAWGRRSILKLNWVDDELFVRKDRWASVFRPLGVECEPVLHHRSGAPLETVVQLKLQQTASLNLYGVPPAACTACGRQKYSPVCRGPFPAVLSMGPPIAKTREYFGSEGTAFNEILVTAALFERIELAGLKGAEFRPCATAGDQTS
ncbi:hypothetical protein [uncultured Paludibaculum sp.]|uniref:hypothetical protein n=1 Tax=uncultured Paludibaculum sp. TaxID=1765020 RepID=UPI002AAAE094|nr:hypothetical protein [uncultured Paludibaculum sp.]